MANQNNLYFIGGGTCCGKSTVSEMLCEKYSFHYFKLDDLLFSYIEKMAEDGHAQSQKEMEMDGEYMWMRDPQILMEDEIKLYEEMFSYAWKDLQNMASTLPGDALVLAEGAGFLPEKMIEMKVVPNRYICVVPTEDFQLEKYAERPWIHEYLKDTSDADTAFSNWMQRDVLFSRKILQEAQDLGYCTLVVDGSKTFEENLKIIENVFQLL